MSAGEALVRLAYLSVDPTNRVWMREEDSYLPAIPIGDVVRAAGLGVVPREPTPAMNLAGARALRDTIRFDNQSERCQFVGRAMFDAAQEG